MSTDCFYSDEVYQRALAAYLGLAIGDALGATTEFMTPYEVKKKYHVHRQIIGGGWLKLKPGSVTDDTEMSLALGKALLEARGMDLKGVADSFIAWRKSKPVDIGDTVNKGLSHYETTGTALAPPSEMSAGNGAAMRNLPVVLATLKDYESFRMWSLDQSRITHNHPLSDAGTLLLGEMTRLAILKEQTAPLKATAMGWINNYPKFDYNKFKRTDDGYIATTIKTVLYFFFHTSDFETCLLGIVNAGGDADTNGALGGMLAGAFYGLDAIPRRWLQQLDKKIKVEIHQQVQELLYTFC
jgi:ADP-ribosyl-[dinitrogen reductase] hydrolase